MEKVLLLYYTEGGNTQEVAEKIAAKLGSDVDVVAVEDATVEQCSEYSNLILGTPTTGLGELPDGWDSFLPELAEADLSGKTIALFGLGDGEGFGDNFVDAMGHIANELKDKGCTLVGQVSSEGYNFSDSIALDGDNFVGLAIDEDNEPEQTDDRVNAWVEEIINKFN